MGLKAAVQALQKADALKAKVNRKCDLLNDSQAWTDQQQLQTVYHQVLVLDLEYALDKKVEQELWTFGFKNHISTLQELSRDRKNPKRSEYQALLSWCLSAASGFYLTLLQELCTVFELDLPFRRKGTIYGQSKSFAAEQLSQPHTSSSIYICQYCLVHLGDIARYRSQKLQAESFYKHAIRLSPTSGHPYNQLALLEASGTDRLATVFYYIRSIAVKNPFPAASANLARTLTSALDKEEPLLEVKHKMSTNEFVRLFLRIHGLFYLATDLEQAELGVKSINATLTAMVATQSFTSLKLIHMTVINLYALKHTVQSFRSNELTVDELKVKDLVLDMLAGALNAFLLPVYTLKMDSSLLEYYALPAIKIILTWIENQPDVLQESVFTNKLQIWPSLCKLLNNLQLFLDDTDLNKYTTIPLPEDRDLQGFLPVAAGLKKYKFSCMSEESEDKNFLLKLRVQRLINFGSWLANNNELKVSLISAKEEKDENGKTKIIFEPANIQPDPTSDLLEEIKHFSVNDVVEKPSLAEEIKVPEKRGGILKPQGSLEKAREEREQALQLSVSSETPGISSDNSSYDSASSTQTQYHKQESKTKRVRQNVALQAIFKKAEAENKQVKFDTESIEKEQKRLHLQQQEQQQLQQQQQQQLIQQQQHQQRQQFNPNLNPNLNANVNLNAVNFDFPLPPSVNDNYAVKYPNPNQQQHFVPPNPMKFNTALSFSAMPSLPPHIPMPNSHNQMAGNHNQMSSIPSAMNQMSGNQIPSGLNQMSNISMANPRNSMPQMKYSAQASANFMPKMPEYKTWSQDQDNLPMPPSTWWPPNAPPPNYQPQPFMQNSYSAHMQPEPPNMMPWGQIQTPTNQAQNQAMTLRQAMLKETKQAATKPFGFREMQQNVPSVKVEVPTPSPQASYSLFNSPIPNWAPNLAGQILKNSGNNVPSSGLGLNMNQHQSLFSNTGISPLEQLLEQQKQMRDTKDDT